MTLGEQGEQIAEAYLKSRGYKVLDQNWEVRGKNGKLIGEIDLIAKTSKGVAIVEVKAGKSADPAWRPEVHMTDQKMQKLSRAAEIWLTQNGGLDQSWQMDLVAVDFSKQPPSVRHYCHFPSE